LFPLRIAVLLPALKDQSKRVADELDADEREENAKVVAEAVLQVRAVRDYLEAL